MEDRFTEFSNLEIVRSIKSKWSSLSMQKFGHSGLRVDQNTYGR